MATGTIYKYNTNRKYNIIRPDEWKTGLMDILFTEKGNYKLGDKVEYDWKLVNGKKYAENLKVL